MDIKKIREEISLGRCLNFDWKFMQNLRFSILKHTKIHVIFFSHYSWPWATEIAQNRLFRGAFFVICAMRFSRAKAVEKIAKREAIPNVTLSCRGSELEHFYFCKIHVHTPRQVEMPGFRFTAVLLLLLFLLLRL